VFPAEGCFVNELRGIKKKKKERKNGIRKFIPSIKVRRKNI